MKPCTLWALGDDYHDWLAAVDKRFMGITLVSIHELTHIDHDWHTHFDAGQTPEDAIRDALAIWVQRGDITQVVADVILGGLQ